MLTSDVAPEDSPLARGSLREFITALSEQTERAVKMRRALLEADPNGIEVHNHYVAITSTNKSLTILAPYKGESGAALFHNKKIITIKVNHVRRA